MSRSELNFNDVYKKKRWTLQGNGSGPGSTLENTQYVRNFFKNFIRLHGITSIIDVSVGGMNWWPDILENFPEMTFHGYDVADDVIDKNKIKFSNKAKWNFTRCDILSDEVNYPPTDLIVCRHTIQHLSLTDGKAVIQKLFNSHTKWISLTTCSIKNNPIKDGHILLLPNTPGCFKCRSMNLTLPPFNLSSPTEICKDDNQKSQVRKGQKLGFWKI